MHRETIYQLLILKLTGSISETDEVYVNTLIENDPEVLALWREIEQDFADPSPKEALKYFDTDELLTTVHNTIQQRRKKRAQRKKLLLFTVAILLSGITTFIYLKEYPLDKKEVVMNRVQLQLSDGEKIDLYDNTTEQNTDRGAITYSTNEKTLTYRINRESNTLATLVVPAGKTYQLRLSDGTAIKLNSGSQLTFPFCFNHNSNREISIRGEAFIKVAADPGLPFIVHTQHALVEVLGTSFNVNGYDSGTVKVSLTDGAVKMITGTQSVKLKPGQQATATQKQISIQPFEEESELAWLNDRYIFRHNTLAEIIPVLERWYAVSIVFDSPLVACEVVTGHILRSDDIKTVMRMLTTISNTNYYYKEDIIHIR